MKVNVVMLACMVCSSGYASDFIKHQLYVCVGATVKSVLILGTGYAIGRLFGSAPVGACAGALAVIASKEYPYGIAREIGHIAPIALVGWYCYADMRNKLQEYHIRDQQGEERLEKCNDVMRDVSEKTTDIKNRMKDLLDQHYERLPRVNSCPNLTLKRTNSFGQIAMNELY